MIEENHKIIMELENNSLDSKQTIQTHENGLHK